MRRGKFLIILGVILIAGALGLTGYNLVESNKAGKAAKTMLGTLEEQITDDPIPEEGREVSGETEYPDYVVNPYMDMPTIEIDGKYYIGTLTMPTLGRDLPILTEWNYYYLTYSPCRYSGSVYLDDMVICAHNYFQHFGTIKNLKIDDPVDYTDVDGNVFHYRVVEVGELDPTEVDEMTTADDWDLTMFTCTLSGAARVTVRCERIREQ